MLASFLCAVPALAQNATVTANLKLLSGGASQPTGTSIRVDLQNCAAPRVPGTGNLGEKSRTFFPSSSGVAVITLWSNGVLDCGAGVPGIPADAPSFYTFNLVSNGGVTSLGSYKVLIGPSTLDSMIPINTVPVIPTPTGDNSYLRIDGGNWAGLPAFPPPVQNWSITGGLTAATGAIAALNGSVNAALSAGADIGAQVNSASASCSDSTPCHVYIPPGVYSYNTAILLPRRTQGLEVTCDRNATLTYTGAGSAVSTVAAVNSGGNAAGTILDGGCALIGTSGGTAGVHFRPGQGYVLDGWQISGFTSGDGIWIDGANSVTVIRSSSTGNLNGLHITGNRCNGANQCMWDRPNVPTTWVNAGTSGTSGFAANAVKVYMNRLSGNTNWGILENDVVGGGNTKAFGNSFTGNVIEGNGVGAAMSGFTRSSSYENNYLEGNTDGIILGCVSGTPSSVVPQTGYTAQFCGTADKSVVQKNFLNDIAGSSEIMFEFADSPSADNNSVNFNAACLGDVHVISGNVSFHDNIVYGTGADTCQDGTPGGPLHNFQVQGDVSLGAEHFFGAAQVDGVLANGQLFKLNTSVPTMTGGPAIIGQMGAITIWQSSVPPTGSCGGPAGMNIAFTPTEMYICSGTWRLVTHS